MFKIKNVKSLLCMLLILVMALTMIGCGKENSQNNNRGEQKKTSYDDVVNMDGYTFTIASNFLQDNPDIASLTDAEAIFETVRRKIEETYNCKIQIIPSDNTVETIRTKILGGDKIADLLDINGTEITQLARSGYIVPLDDIDGLDITDKRWISGYTRLAEFNGKHYGMNFMRPAEARVCLVYNKELLKKFGVTEDPQKLVKENKWTFEKFAEMAKKCTGDSNGDGVTDTYGVYTRLPNLFGLSMVAANGGKLVSMEDGIAKETFTDKKVITALDFVNKMVNEDKSFKIATEADSNASISSKEIAAHFVKNEAAFIYCESWVLNQAIKPVAGDMGYGILPLPIGPDATDYVSPAENARNFCISSTNKDVEKTVIIANALAKAVAEYGEGDDWWEYDVEADYFQMGDTESVDIYMMLIDKATIDLGVGVSDLWNDFQTKVIGETIFSRKGTPASKIQSIKGKYNDAINSIYN